MRSDCVPQLWCLCLICLPFPATPSLDPSFLDAVATAIAANLTWTGPLFDMIFEFDIYEDIEERDASGVTKLNPNKYTTDENVAEHLLARWQDEMMSESSRARLYKFIGEEVGNKTLATEVKDNLSMWMGFEKQLIFNIAQFFFFPPLCVLLPWTKKNHAADA